MLTLNKIKERTLVYLQQYPELAARYEAGDLRVTGPIGAWQHVLAEMGRDIDLAVTEPFVKSREATILADATSKGILPWATPCQYKVIINNSGEAPVTLQSNRVIEDGQGRAWRLLQHAVCLPGIETVVPAEQSEIREVKYKAIATESFHSFELPLQDELSVVSLSVKDQQDNAYNFITGWMNCLPGDYAISLKTDSRRSIMLEFGDSARFGRTLEADTELYIQIIESNGEVDVSALKEATLQVLESVSEGKLMFRFSDTAGLIQQGADPLTTEQLRLLASYPTHDVNAVFLSDFDFLVRKKFMNRTHFTNVWNEAVHEQFFGSDYRNINKLFVSFVAKNPDEIPALQADIRRHIALADNLYKDQNTVFIEPSERLFKIRFNITLSPVHIKETVEDQIRTLMISEFGKGKIATSYHVANGFNTLEISTLLRQRIPAFQDRMSDFRVETEDLVSNPVKPNEVLFVSEDSIEFETRRSSATGESRWSVL